MANLNFQVGDGGQYLPRLCIFTKPVKKNVTHISQRVARFNYDGNYFNKCLMKIFKSGCILNPVNIACRIFGL